MYEKRMLCKFTFIVFDLTRTKIEPYSTVSVAVVVSNRPPIGIWYRQN